VSIESSLRRRPESEGTLSRNIPWPRVAAEGIAILASILLAFAVQAWWEGRQARQELRELLVLLDNELTRNSERLQISLDEHRNILETIETAVERGSASPQDVPSHPMASVEVYNPVTGALEAVGSSGLLGRIEDTELRVLIASTPGLLDDLAEKEERALMRRELARNRWAALGLRIGDLPTGPTGDPRVDDLPPDSPYLADTELLNLLVMRQTEEYLVIHASRALLEHFGEIRGRLAGLGIGSNRR
jgi:hypothetical protein